MKHEQATAAGADEEAPLGEGEKPALDGVCLEGLARYEETVELLQRACGGTAACGLGAWKPPPIATNLTGPGASGSCALVLRSMRSLHPCGACAMSGALASAANAVINRYRFMIVSSAA